MLHRFAVFVALALVVGCAETLVGPEAQSAAREYQSKAIDDDRIPLVFVNGKEVSVDSMRKFPTHLIESVSVLKGAKALQDYGERARNGVILVRSK